eukprot:COSAG01_NODE_3318_length_6272_cov_2.193261_13_plen_81_part_00
MVVLLSLRLLPAAVLDLQSLLQPSCMHVACDDARLRSLRAFAAWKRQSSQTQDPQSSVCQCRIQQCAGRTSCLKYEWRFY